MGVRIETVNINILRQCREQMGLGIAEVAKKVPRIAAFESGDVAPTLRQLDQLAHLYDVPRWVFVSESLPREYRFESSIPVFRQFAHTDPDRFEDSTVRSIVDRVERMRTLILDLADESEDDDTWRFDGPDLGPDPDPEEAAGLIREWLTVPDGPMSFADWRTRIETHGVFVFMTSKYPGWSHVQDHSFRGFCINHALLPIVVVNSSDARKAQSFTLLHELGHLLRRESSMDVWGGFDRQTERWCDRFAGAVLMPAELVARRWEGQSALSAVKKLSPAFGVSPYARLVRARQLGLISQFDYEQVEDSLLREYEDARTRLRSIDGGPSRNRVSETLYQYGEIYARAVFNAFNAKELGLNRAMHLLGLKRPSQALEAHDFVATEVPAVAQLRSLQLERKYEVSEFSKGCSVNDMALIAYALEFDAIVVTGESYQVNRPGERRNFKIPLVCKEEGVEFTQFIPMLESLGFGR